LTSALFDVPAEALEAEVSFWSGVLGRRAVAEESEPDYVEFDGLSSGLALLVQRIGGDAVARVHLDVETDDVEAEVARLEALGAERVEKVKTWWVLRDPAGLLFCVVRVQQRAEFEASATVWGGPE
jgi:catechol 2,3-dioxygenase-like lactoylglutathione lyase family enzyme